MTFLQFLTKNEIIKSLTETQTTILQVLSSFRSNQQYEGNQTNSLTCLKQQSPAPTPSQKQKQTYHSKHSECLRSSDKDICNYQKTEKVQNVQYAPKQNLEV